MASSRGGYDGGSSAGGKIRRRPTHRAAVGAAPYARPPPAAPSCAGEGGWWLSRIVDPASRLLASGATRLFSSVFRKPPRPLLDAPPPPPLLDAQPPRQPSLLDAPPSLPSLPLEDDLPEGEEDCEGTTKNLSTENPDTSAKDGFDMIKCSDDRGDVDLEELLRQKTFTRTEFEHLAELLRSRTIDFDTLKPGVNKKEKDIHVSEKEKGTRDSNLPVDFSIRTRNVADQVASPAELAKAYMGSRSSNGSPLRLRLHDPASLPIKSIEDNPAQIAKPPALPLLPSPSMRASTLSDHLRSNHITPNRSEIYRMSSSPYFKSAVSSRDLSGTVLSSYQSPSSVHTFGRQVLKRKSNALKNESVSVGPMRRMRQRYNTISPLLETRPGYHGSLSRASKPDEDSAQTQKRQRLDKVGDGALGVHDNSFGHAPPQSTEMAAKILKQLDTLVSLHKEDTTEMSKNGNATNIEDHLSQKKGGSAQGNLLEPFTLGVKVSSLVNKINGAAKFSPTAVDGKAADAISDKSAVLMSKSNSGITPSEASLEQDNHNKRSKVACNEANDKIEKNEPAIPEHTSWNSGTTNKEKPPKFSSRSHTLSSLILSNELDRNKSLDSSNGFTFPVPAALSPHSQAPPTPTMASPPILPAVKQHSCSSAATVPPDAAMENVLRTSKSVSEEVSIMNKCDKKLNVEDLPNSSNQSSGEVASVANPPVFSFANSKSPTIINGLAYTSKSSAGPSNGSISSIFSTNAGPSTNSLAQHPFQSGSLTASSPLQKSGIVQVNAEPIRAASFFEQSSATGGTFTLSNTSTGGSSAASKMFASTASQSIAAPSLAPIGAGSRSAPFGFSPQFGGASSLVAQEKSKAAPTESAFGTWLAESGNKASPFTQNSTSTFSSISSATSNSGNSSSFANPSFGSAPSGSSPLNSSSIFSFAAGSGSSVSLNTPASSSGFESSSGFSPSPIFGSNLTSTGLSSFGLPSTASVSPPSIFGSTSSPVFSFASTTPMIPNPSPTEAVFGTQNPGVGLSPGTDQMTVDKNQPPFSTAPSFGLPSTSPVTPLFSSPATQPTSTTSAATGIFQFGQQSQVPPGGGFSLGTGGGDDKSGRRILKVKRRK